MGGRRGGVTVKHRELLVSTAGFAVRIVLAALALLVFLLALSVLDPFEFSIGSWRKEEGATSILAFIWSSLKRWACCSIRIAASCCSSSFRFLPPKPSTILDVDLFGLEILVVGFEIQLRYSEFLNLLRIEILVFGDSN